MTKRVYLFLGLVTLLGAWLLQEPVGIAPTTTRAAITRRPAATVSRVLR